MLRALKIFVLALTVLALVVGCGKNAAETAIESQTGGKVKVRTDKKSVEIKTKEGTFKVGDNKLPDDFPSDVPIYKPATVEGSVSTNVSNGQSFMVTLTSSDALDEVAEYYKAKLASNGWSEKSVMSGGEGGSKFANLGYEKGDSLVTVTIARADNDSETQIVISHGPKQ